jgi:hypothetical protein
MNLRTALTAIVSLACAAVSLADELPSASAQIRGADTKNLRVLIRTIDDGEILWVAKFKLGTTASVSPGHHRLALMCELHETYGLILKPAKLELDAEAGKTYALTANVTPESKGCEIAVSAGS